MDFHSRIALKKRMYFGLGRFSYYTGNFPTKFPIRKLMGCDIFPGVKNIIQWNRLLTVSGNLDVDRSREKPAMLWNLTFFFFFFSNEVLQKGAALSCGWRPPSQHTVCWFTSANCEVFTNGPELQQMLFWIVKDGRYDGYFRFL